MLVTMVRSSVLLPERGPPTTATWPAGAGEVERHGVAALLARAVDGAERHHQARDVAPARRDQAEVGVLDEVGHQLVEGVGHVERRQPDLVGRHALADHPLHGDVEQRGLLALLLAAATGVSSTSVSSGSSACTSEIV